MVVACLASWIYNRRLRQRLSAAGEALEALESLVKRNFADC